MRTGGGVSSALPDIAGHIVFSRTVIAIVVIPPAHSGLQTLTDFGDAAVLLPLSAIFFLWLLATRSASLAFTWALTLVVCNVLMGVLKVYFLTCPFGAELRSPSGHTGFSLLVYGALTATMALEARKSWVRAAIVAIGTALVAAIGVSRFMIQSHSMTEVVIGAVIGGAGLLFFVRVYRRKAGGRRWFLPLALGVIAIAFFFHGRKLGVEDYLQNVSAMLEFRTRICGYR